MPTTKVAYDPMNNQLIPASPQAMNFWCFLWPLITGAVLKFSLSLETPYLRELIALLISFFFAIFFVEFVIRALTWKWFRAPTEEDIKMTEQEK